MNRIVLSAPGKNALSIAVLEGLRRAVEATRGEPFVLTGAGGVFCAGLNLKELATLDVAGVQRLLEALDGAVDALFHHPAPTSAWVNGHAIAGGCVPRSSSRQGPGGTRPRWCGSQRRARSLPPPVPDHLAQPGVTAGHAHRQEKRRLDSVAAVVGVLELLAGVGVWQLSMISKWKPIRDLSLI
jgi:hypothetical protein